MQHVKRNRKHTSKSPTKKPKAKKSKNTNPHLILPPIPSATSSSSSSSSSISYDSKAISPHSQHINTLQFQLERWSKGGDRLDILRKDFPSAFTTLQKALLQASVLTNDKCLDQLPWRLPSPPRLSPIVNNNKQGEKSTDRIIPHPVVPPPQHSSSKSMLESPSQTFTNGNNSNNSNNAIHVVHKDMSSTSSSSSSSSSTYAPPKKTKRRRRRTRVKKHCVYCSYEPRNPHKGRCFATSEKDMKYFLELTEKDLTRSTPRLIKCPKYRRWFMKYYRLQDLGNQSDHPICIADCTNRQCRVISYQKIHDFLYDREVRSDPSKRDLISICITNAIRRKYPDDDNDAAVKDLWEQQQSGQQPGADGAVDYPGDYDYNADLNVDFNKIYGYKQNEENESEEENENEEENDAMEED